MSVRRGRCPLWVRSAHLTRHEKPDPHADLEIFSLEAPLCAEGRASRFSSAVATDRLTND
jgi:hypothetical protein